LAAGGAEMKQSTTRKLFSYWNILRADRTAPERADIDPAVIRALLRDTFILEVDAERTLPVRVAGARVASLFMRELKGASFRDLHHEDSRRCLDAIVESVLDDPAPAVAGINAAPAGRAPLDMELLLLPLRHQGKTHSRILGSLAPSAFASWMGLLEIQPLRISSLRIIRPETMRDQSDRMEQGDPVALFPPASSPQSMKPFTLRVVGGGRAG
jgi:hypothetical protein